MRKALKWIFGLLALVLIVGIALGWESDRDAAALKAKYASSASRFVAISPGLAIHLRDEGRRDGPVLLLVHGSNASLHTWQPWVQRLGNKYRIISLDLPGHGLTGADPARDYSYRSFVSVVDKVVTKLDIPRFAIAGNSMGGGVAWHYALAHPDKVTAIGLIDAAGAPAWEARSVPLGFKLARTPVLRDVMKHVTPRSLVERSLKQSVSNHAIVKDAAVDRYWELLLYPGNRQATLDRFAVAHNNEPANNTSMARIAVPTLVMWGEEDGLIPLSSGRWFAKAIPGAQLVTYPTTGHIPMEELPDQSAADMGRFLARSSAIGARPRL